MKKEMEKAEKAIKETEKRELEEKSKEKYGDWLNERRKKEEEIKRQCEEKKREEEEKKAARHRKAEEEYERWKAQANTRPKSVQNSFGYTCGKLTGKVTFISMYKSF